MFGKALDKIAEQAPLVIIIIGVLGIILAASGGLTIGNFNIQILDIYWRYALAGLFVILVISGLFFQYRETAKPHEESLKEKSKTDRVSTDNSLTKPESYSLRDPKLRNIIPDLSERFRIVCIPKRESPHIYAVPHAPCGLFIINDIPFYLDPFYNQEMKLSGHRIINLDPSAGNIACIEEIPVDINSVTKIHFLLAAGNGWTESNGVIFADRRIGYIELLFEDRSSQKVDLVLGKHLREWAFGNSPYLVKDIDSMVTKPAWVSYDIHYLLDFMTIVVAGKPKNLSKIRIVAKFDGEPGDNMYLPAIMISGITCSLAF